VVIFFLRFLFFRAIAASIDSFSCKSLDDFTLSSKSSISCLSSLISFEIGLSNSNVAFNKGTVAR
jgi:hypothetical protein